MRTRQKRVATDTWRSLGCRTTPLEHWSRRKPTVEPRWAKQQTKKLRPKPTKPLEQRKRPFCVQVERETHVCFNCNLYDDIRTELFRKALVYKPGF